MIAVSMSSRTLFREGTGLLHIAGPHSLAGGYVQTHRQAGSQQHMLLCHC